MCAWKRFILNSKVKTSKRGPSFLVLTKKTAQHFGTSPVVLIIYKRIRGIDKLDDVNKYYRYIQIHENYI